MKLEIIITSILFLLSTNSYAQSNSNFKADIAGLLNDTEAAFVLIDCSNDNIKIYNPDLAKQRTAPCSTFKIWNTLIGLESKIISSPTEPFYTWDGVERIVPQWNKNLNLRDAFQASCVPAFQSLAQEIGSKEMQAWIERLNYGDMDTSAGITTFWLPEKNRKTILISPIEQAKLIKKLISQELPFSSKNIVTLKKIMKAKETENSTIYAKTGSGTNDAGIFVLGWYVGFIENNKKSYAFACIAKGNNILSKDARKITEHILITEGLL